MNYKYNINHFISLLPKSKTMEIICSELEKEQIPSRTFYKDKAILLTQSKDIPAARLMKYAKFFAVSIDELFNYTHNIKSISDRKIKPSDKRLINKTGLKK